MKIAFIGDYPLDTNLMSGGVEAVSCNIVEGLAKLNNLDLHVITCRRQIEKAYVTKRKNTIIHYLPGQRRLNRSAMDVFDVIRIRRKLYEIAPDVIHSHDQGRYTYAALTTKYPVVMTISSISSEGFRMKNSLRDRFLRKLSSRLMENRCLGMAKDIIAISPYVMQTFSKRTNATFHNIPNPVRDGFFRLPNNEQRNRLLFAGRVVPLKGIHVLLEALALIKAQIQDVTLHIAGPILERDYYAKLNNLIRKNNLIDNVVFLGLLNESRLMDEYSKCAIFVLPTFTESFSLVSAQALAAGKPVIASDVGGIPSVINDGETGFLVRVDDAESISQKITTLLQDDDLRKMMGEQGRSIAAKRFATDIIARQTRSIYDLIYERYKKATKCSQ